MRWRSFLFAILLFGPWLSEPAYAQSLTIQGRVSNSAGTPITGTAVQFRVQVRAPNAASCVLFDETHTLNLSATNGLFSVNLNDGTGTVNTPTTYPLEAAISNRAAFSVNSAYCNSGTGVVTYTPGVGDNRKVVIQFYDPASMSGFETIPAMDLNPMAFSMESRTVGGYPATSMLRVDTAGNPGTAPALTVGEATELQLLANGTSTKYTPASSTNGAQIPTYSSDPAAPPAGSIWYNSTTGELHYRTSGGTQVVGAGGGGGGTITSISVSGGLSGGGSSGAVRIGLPSGSGGQVLRYTSGNWSGYNFGLPDLLSTSLGSAVASAACTAGQTMYYDTTAKELKCQSIGLGNASISGTLGVANGGTGLTSGSVGALPYFSATNAISALAVGSNGQVLTVSAGGLPTWQNLPSASFSGTGTTNRLAKFTGASAVGNSILTDDGTNVGIGTTAPIARLEVAGSLRLADGGETCSAGANVGMMKYSGGSLFFCNASGWQTLGVSGAGLTSLNGLTANTQTFAIGSAGTSPAWSSAGSVHTLNLPAASASSSGVLSSADWSTFNGKLGAGATFGGDVTGTYNASVVTALRGVGLDTTAPAPGQVLKLGASTWGPSNLTFGDLKTTGGAATLASAACNAGQTMYYDSSTGDLKCQAIAVDNASVTGTLAVAHGGTGASSTSQNHVFAGPTSGSGAPSFRALTTADISGLDTYWASATGGINYAGGNVGIGSTAPTSKLDVSGTLRVADGGEGCSGGTNGGMVKYNGGSLYFCNGTGWQQLGVSGAGLTSLNGLTSSSQTFAIGSAGTSPAWSSASGVHTLNLPTASASNTGVLSSSDWSAFNAKLGASSVFAGDVTGTYNANVVTKLQGVAVGTTAPSAGQVLKYGTSWAAANLGFGDLKTTGGAATMASAVCNAGQTMYFDTSTGDLKCQSIGLANASISGVLPIANGGTGASSTSQNYVFAGPTSGSGAPAFRALTTADISGLSTYWNSATGGIAYSAGNVGIGTSTPGGLLEVSKASDPAVLYSNTAAVANSNIISEDRRMFSTTQSRVASRVITGWVDSTDASRTSYWALSTNSNGGFGEAVRVSGGNVGIGSTVPATSLDLSAKTDALSLPKGSTAQQPASVPAGSLRYNTNNLALEFFNGSTWVTLSAGGAGTYYSASGGTVSGNVTITPSSGTGLTVTSGGANIAGGLTSSGVLSVSNSTASTSTTTGAATIAGGLGVAGTVNANILAAAAGTAANPSHTFTSDLTSGLWLPGASTLAWSTGGTERMRLTSSGNIGIGTTNPSQQLHLTGAIRKDFSSSSGGTSYWWMGNNDGAGNWSEYINSIGTTSPTAVAEGAAFRRTYTTATVSGVNSLYHQYATPVTAGSAQTWKNYLTVDAKNNYLTLMDNGGNVGINNTAPDSPLTVSSSSTAASVQLAHLSSGANASGTSYSTIRLEKGTMYGGEISGFINQSVTSGLAFNVLDGATSTEVMRIQAGNRVGIGTTAPSQRLHVAGGGIRIAGTGAANPGNLMIDDGVTEFTGNSFQIQKDAPAYWAVKSVTSGNDMALIVDNTLGRGLYIKNATGNVGVGTTAPAAKLEVSGGIIGGNTVDRWTASRTGGVAGIATPTTATWTTVPGLSITFTLTRAAKVTLNFNGEMRSNSTTTGSYLHAGLRFNVDGTGRGDSTWGERLQMATYTSWWQTMTNVQTVSLAAGTHTVTAQANVMYSGGNSYICAEWDGSLMGYTDCTLTIDAVYQ